MSSFQLTSHDTPTTPLSLADLRRTALTTIDRTTAELIDQARWLRDIIWTCNDEGYPLPFSPSDLAPITDTLRFVQGLVRAELNSDQPLVLTVGEKI